MSESPRARPETIRKRSATAAGAFLTLALLAASQPVSGQDASTTAETRTSDFDGDGFADLIVGVPFEDVGTTIHAGAAHIFYGSPDGISADRDRLLHQDVNGSIDEAEKGDRFGSSSATGDFDGDGYADAAISVPAEVVVGVKGAGAVAVLYGSPDGLTVRGDRWLTEPSEKILHGDHFGAVLSSGDFDGDGYADLVAGTPDDAVTGADRAGSVTLVPGSADGLAPSDATRLTQTSLGLAGGSSASERFGASVAAGDFDGDGFADLAAGAPNEGTADVGAVLVLRGSPAGVVSTGGVVWSQDSPGVPGRAEGLDMFGRSLAADNFGLGIHDDLAIGVREHLPDQFAAGAVNVLYGSPNGLSAGEGQYWTQDSNGIRGRATEFDEFGSALASGDLGRTDHADLAIGAFGEGPDDHGAVNVLYGSTAGLSSDDDQLWSGRIRRVAEGWLGFCLMIGDFGRTPREDLAAGAPLESGRSRSGAANVLYGRADGLTSDRVQFWDQNAPGVSDVAERGDRFGWCASPL